LDQGNRTVDEPIGFAPGEGIFPFDRWKAGLVRPKNEFGNVARSTAQRMNIEGVQELHEPMLLLSAQAERGEQELDRLAANPARKTQCHIKPQLDRSKVKRNVRPQSQVRTS